MEHKQIEKCNKQNIRQNRDLRVIKKINRAINAIEELMA